MSTRTQRNMSSLSHGVGYQRVKAVKARFKRCERSLLSLHTLMHQTCATAALTGGGATRERRGSEATEGRHDAPKINDTLQLVCVCACVLPRSLFLVMAAAALDRGPC